MIHYDPSDTHSVAALYACAEASPSTRDHWLDKLASLYVAQRCPNAVAAARLLASGQAWPAHGGNTVRRAVRS